MEKLRFTNMPSAKGTFKRKGRWPRVREELFLMGLVSLACEDDLPPKDSMIYSQPIRHTMLINIELSLIGRINVASMFIQRHKPSEEFLMKIHLPCLISISRVLAAAHFPATLIG